MAHLTNPIVQARIYQARRKKVQQLASTVRVSYAKGLRAGAQVARDLVSEGVSDIYDFESLVLCRLGVIRKEHRVVRGADMSTPRSKLLEEARSRAGESSSETDQIKAALAVARTAHEAWVLHRELTGLERGTLTEERREQLAGAVKQKFPD
jgi:hypothetical protein